MPMTRIGQTRYAIAGVVGAYTAAVSDQWLKIAPVANPGMLEIFRDRDRKPQYDGKHRAISLSSVLETV